MNPLCPNPEHGPLSAAGRVTAPAPEAGYAVTSEVYLCDRCRSGTAVPFLWKKLIMETGCVKKPK